MSHEKTPFRYVGGDFSLDLVNTVNWTERDLEAERLTSYERLTRWAEGAGLLPPGRAKLLRERAKEEPSEADEALARSLELRELLKRLFWSIDGREKPGTVWDELNAWLEEALSRLRVRADGEPAGPVARWVWNQAEDFDSFLFPIVWSAAKLVTSEEASRIEVCDGPDCGWVYVDRSRNRFRRWCEMETCGTAAKSRRRRKRRQRT